MSARTASKKMINTPETCVDDNLRGLVATFPALQLHPRHRVITLRDQGDSGRVAILGGGGSGHEPFAGGLVGAGMLHGAVAGGVFASPPTGHVLYAIAALHKQHSGGVLVIIGNYTGDRLNFGKAIEKAKVAGIKVEGLIVGEDVASSDNKTGGRSMCGEVYFYKLCSAMSAKGFELLKIKEIAVEANKHMATLGVTLAPCSLPGQPPLFEIAADEMELGAGVHGEAGIHTLKVASARDTVALILDKIVEHLKLAAGDRVAVMVDNLGGTSFLEMNIIAGETRDYLESKKMKVERIFSGHLKTSLEMQGFQICVLHLNKQYGDLWLECLDAPTEAAAWPGGALSRGAPGLHEDDPSLASTHTTHLSTGPVLSAKQQAVLKGGLRAAAEALARAEGLLNELDAGCGDGDCGNTMKKLALAVQSYIESAPLERPASVLWALSELAETDMGGSSGGIYSLGLGGAAHALATGTKNEPALWLNAWEEAIKAISTYGGAEPGDRTMLDTLHAAATAFKQNLDADLRTLLNNTMEAAESGARDTANMIARAGRASYVSREHVRGEDAGARAAAVWLPALLAHIRDHYC